MRQQVGEIGERVAALGGDHEQSAACILGDHGATRDMRRAADADADRVEEHERLRHLSPRTRVEGRGGMREVEHMRRRLTLGGVGHEHTLEPRMTTVRDGVAVTHEQAHVAPVRVELAGVEHRERMQARLPLDDAGRTAEALSAIQEAKKLVEQAPIEPAISSMHAQIAWIHYHAHQLDEAIKVYEEVLKKYPNDQRVQETSRFSLSAIYVLKQDYVKGESLLQEVLNKDPENSQANNDLGYLWADQSKNLDQAYEMIQKALSKEPDNAAYLDSLGWVLFRQGKLEEAAQKLVQACGMKRGDDPTLREHLGDCYAKMGKTEEARKAWQEGLDLMVKKKSHDEKLKKSLREKLGLPPA